MAPLHGSPHARRPLCAYLSCGHETHFRLNPRTSSLFTFCCACRHCAAHSKSAPLNTTLPPLPARCCREACASHGRRSDQAGQVQVATSEDTSPHTPNQLSTPTASPSPFPLPCAEPLHRLLRSCHGQQRRLLRSPLLPHTHAQHANPAFVTAATSPAAVADTHAALPAAPGAGSGRHASLAPAPLPGTPLFAPWALTGCQASCALLPPPAAVTWTTPGCGCLPPSPGQSYRKCLSLVAPLVASAS